MLTAARHGFGALGHHVNEMRNAVCTLCGATDVRDFCRAVSRRFLRCADCGLLFIPPEDLPAALDERARYACHQNDPADARYRRFLSPMAEAILNATEQGAVGLDFGCGPGPALAHMLSEAGRVIMLYDPFFAPDEAVWSRVYDFIVATEVFEHLHRPAFELDRLFGALRTSGVLGIMTAFAPDTAAEFAQWHYIRDPTHVCFFSRRAFEYIAMRWGATVRFPAQNVALLVRAGRSDKCAAEDASRA